MALPLLVQLFTPPGHENVLAAVDTILLDAGAVQTAVFNEIRATVFPSAVVKFCYFHEIKQKFQTSVLPCTPQSQLKAHLKETILTGLIFIFMEAENAAEQAKAWQTLETEITKLPAAVKHTVHAFCHDKFSKWTGSIGKVLLSANPQACSFDRRCFDSFTTNRVEQENASLKAGRTGVNARTTTRGLLDAVLNKDRDRAQRNAEASARAATALPLKTEKILDKLYPYLPTRIIVMLEDQCQRMRKQILVGSSLNAIKLRGSEKELFGNPPRTRTVSCNSEGLLTCDCGFFKR